MVCQDIFASIFWLMVILGDVLIFLGNSFSGFPGTFLNHLESGSGSFATGPNVSKYII